MWILQDCFKIVRFQLLPEPAIGAGLSARAYVVLPRHHHKLVYHMSGKREAVVVNTYNAAVKL